MLIKITFPILLLILSPGITRAQFFKSVEKEATDIFVSLSTGSSVSLDDFANLNYSLRSDSSESTDSLKEHLYRIESDLDNISTDSVLVLFNQWYLHLNKIFYDYNKEKFFSSEKTKILFFSTSMSCHCTLELCKKQLVEILKLKKETGNSYSFLIVDSYWNNDLQLKYETYFAPSVLVFNQSNELILKIEYEEEMIEKVTTFLLESDKI